MGLTVVQVEEIHRLHAGAVRARQIGEIVGVSIRTVNEVLDGRKAGRPLTPREQAELDAQQGWRAACMDDSEWVEWISKNSLSMPDGDAAARPCKDCPLGFAADMRAQGRCNGTPGGVAEEIDQEEEEPMDNIAPAPRPDPGIRIAVALEAPCPACVKADVCSLRPLVEQLQSVQVATPKMDPLLGLQLAGTVTCRAFVKDRIRKADASELGGKPGRKPAQAPTPIAADPRVVQPGTTLTPRQAQILEAFRRNGGDRQATAKELDVVYQSIDAGLEAVALKGLLPEDLLEHVPARIRRLQLGEPQAVAS